MAKGKKGKKGSVSKRGSIGETSTPETLGSATADGRGNAQSIGTIETDNDGVCAGSEVKKDLDMDNEALKDTLGVLNESQIHSDDVSGAVEESMEDSLDTKSIGDIDHHECLNGVEITDENRQNEQETALVEENLNDIEKEKEEYDIEKEKEESEEDDDFGSFDEASFEEFHADERLNLPDSHTVLLFPDTQITPEKILCILDYLFPSAPTKTPHLSGSLLSQKAEAQFLELLKTPRLQPPNWTKLKLRHKLLLRLGIPINLDELVNPSNLGGGLKTERVRRTLVAESDLDWSRFAVPDLDGLDLSQEAQQELLRTTNDTLSQIETQNMSHTSELHLQKCLAGELDSKLASMQENHTRLLGLASVWHGHINDLKVSQNVFESVVQNMVGYNQKIQRNEMLESLRRSKSRRGKKTF